MEHASMNILETPCVCGAAVLPCCRKAFVECKWAVAPATQNHNHNPSAAATHPTQNVLLGVLCPPSAKSFSGWACALKKNCFQIYVP